MNQSKHINGRMNVIAVSIALVLVAGGYAIGESTRPRMSSSGEKPPTAPASGTGDTCTGDGCRIGPSGFATDGGYIGVASNISLQQNYAICFNGTASCDSAQPRILYGGSNALRIDAAGATVMSIAHASANTIIAAGTFNLTSTGMDVSDSRLDFRSAGFTNFSLGTVGNEYMGYCMACDTNGSALLTVSTGAQVLDQAKVGGVVGSVSTGVGNVSDCGTDDDLQTDTLTSGMLRVTNRGVTIRAFGTTANNINAKTVAIAFGSQTLLTKELAASVAGRWEFEVRCTTTGTDTQDCFVVGHNYGGITVSSVDGPTVQDRADFVLGTQDDGADIIVKTICTTATATDDIISQGLILTYF